MGMTIEEATLYMELYKRKLFNSVGDLEKDIEAYDIAINTMRKYQEIKEYISIPSRYGTMAEDCQKLEYVRKVVEDGNDD